MARLRGEERIQPFDALHFGPDAQELRCRAVRGVVQVSVHRDDILLTDGLLRDRQAELTARTLADERADVRAREQCRWRPRPTLPHVPLQGTHWVLLLC